MKSTSNSKNTRDLITEIKKRINLKNKCALTSVKIDTSLRQPFYTKPMQHAYEHISYAVVLVLIVQKGSVKQMLAAPASEAMLRLRSGDKVSPTWCLEVTNTRLK